jgi:hypothetical protein
MEDLEMKKRMEIYYSDLNPRTQLRILELLLGSEVNENWDITPIAVFEREVDESKEKNK